MKLAPVVMFVYNREDHFIQTYKSLCRCPEAKQTDLYIFSDGPKNDKQIEKVKNVRSVLKKIIEDDSFLSVHVVENSNNRGLAKSVISGVTEVIETYGCAIVVEDDCSPAPSFLKYMNQCLNYYETDNRVGAVAGFTPEIDFPESFNEDVFFAYRSCSWGWATWRDRWNDVDWDLKNMKDFYRNPRLIKLLNSNGNDRFIRLYRQTKGNGSSWSVRFGAHLVRKNQLTVYPKYSYIKNIGCDASGVHSQIEDAEKMQVDLTKAIENPKLCQVSVIPEIQRNMKKHYSAGTLSNIKRWLATMYIIIKERKKVNRYEWID